MSERAGPARNSQFRGNIDFRPGVRDRQVDLRERQGQLPFGLGRSSPVEEHDLYRETDQSLDAGARADQRQQIAGFAPGDWSGRPRFLTYPCQDDRGAPGHLYPKELAGPVADLVLRPAHDRPVAPIGEDIVREVRNRFPQGELAQVQHLHLCGPVAGGNLVGQHGRTGQDGRSRPRDVGQSQRAETVHRARNDLHTPGRVGHHQRPAGPVAVADGRAPELKGVLLSRREVILHSQPRRPLETAAEEHAHGSRAALDLAHVGAADAELVCAIGHGQVEAIAPPPGDGHFQPGDDLLSPGAEVPGDLASNLVSGRPLGSDRWGPVLELQDGPRREGQFTVSSDRVRTADRPSSTADHDLPSRGGVEPDQGPCCLRDGHVEVVTVAVNVPQHDATGQLVLSGLCRRESQPASPGRQAGLFAVDGDLLPGQRGREHRSFHTLFGMEDEDAMRRGEGHPSLGRYTEVIKTPLRNQGHRSRWRGESVVCRFTEVAAPHSKRHREVDIIEDARPLEERAEHRVPILSRGGSRRGSEELECQTECTSSPDHHTLPWGMRNGPRGSW